jgi:hypothetical protein
MPFVSYDLTSRANTKSLQDQADEDAISRWATRPASERISVGNMDDVEALVSRLQNDKALQSRLALELQELEFLRKLVYRE